MSAIEMLVAFAIYVAPLLVALGVLLALAHHYEQAIIFRVGEPKE